MKGAEQIALFPDAEIPRARKSPRQIARDIGEEGYPPIVTLEKFCGDQDGTISLRTLEAQCHKGLIPGAFKIGNKWWLNLLVMKQQGLDYSGEVSEEPAKESANRTPPPKGYRGSRNPNDQGRPTLPSQKEASRPSPRRYDPKLLG